MCEADGITDVRQLAARLRAEILIRDKLFDCAPSHNNRDRSRTRSTVRRAASGRRTALPTLHASHVHSELLSQLDLCEPDRFPGAITHGGPRGVGH